MAACRDAMAFFSINFSREPVIRKWLAGGKPLAPAVPVGATTPAASGATPGAPATEAEEDAAEDSEEGNSA